MSMSLFSFRCYLKLAMSVFHYFANCCVIKIRRQLSFFCIFPLSYDEVSLGNVLLNSNKTGILCKCHYGCSVNALLLGINIKWFSYINLFTQGAQYFWQQISDMEGSFKDVLTTVQFINSFLNRKQCLAFYIFKNIDKATKTTKKKCYQ